MNIRSAFLVRMACLLLAQAWVLSGAAQGSGKALTGDFDKLSPKERSKVAAKETQEAAGDSGYQKIMQDADAAFRVGQYEEALAAFEQARILRPYNVYPKVKIQDLQSLIQRRDKQRSAEAQAVPITTSLPDTSGTPVVPAVVAPQVTAEPAIAPVAALPADSAAPARPPVVEVPKPGTAPMPVNSVPPAPAANTRVRPVPAPEAKPASEGERVYVEAGATVVERTVLVDHRPVVYKKVVHPWGQTFHFKDGVSISEREWKDRFNE